MGKRYIRCISWMLSMFCSALSAKIIFLSHKKQDLSPGNYELMAESVNHNTTDMTCHSDCRNNVFNFSHVVHFKNRLLEPCTNDKTIRQFGKFMLLENIEIIENLSLGIESSEWIPNHFKASNKVTIASQWKMSCNEFNSWNPTRVKEVFQIQRCPNRWG